MSWEAAETPEGRRGIVAIMGFAYEHPDALAADSHGVKEFREFCKEPLGDDLVRWRAGFRMACVIHQAAYERHVALGELLALF